MNDHAKAAVRWGEVILNAVVGSSKVEAVSVLCSASSCDRCPLQDAPVTILGNEDVGRLALEVDHMDREAAAFLGARPAGVAGAQDRRAMGSAVRLRVRVEAHNLLFAPKRQGHSDAYPPTGGRLSNGLSAWGTERRDQGRTRSYLPVSAATCRSPRDSLPPASTLVSRAGGGRWRARPGCPRQGTRSASSGRTRTRSARSRGSRGRTRPDRRG